VCFPSQLSTPLSPFPVRYVPKTYLVAYNDDKNQPKVRQDFEEDRNVFIGFIGIKIRFIMVRMVVVVCKKSKRFAIDTVSRHGCGYQEMRLIPVPGGVGPDAASIW